MKRTSPSSRVPGQCDIPRFPPGLFWGPPPPPAQPRPVPAAQPRAFPRDPPLPWAGGRARGLRGRGGGVLGGTSVSSERAAACRKLNPGFVAGVAVGIRTRVLQLQRDSPPHFLFFFFLTIDMFLDCQEQGTFVTGGRGGDNTPLPFPLRPPPHFPSLTVLGR